MVKKGEKHTEQKQILRLLKPILIFPLNVMVIIPGLILCFSGKLKVIRINLVAITSGGTLVIIGLFIAWTTVSLLVKIGQGTPAPWDPPKNLVIKGWYKYVRNPMMIAVWCILIGESIIFQSFYIFLWFIIFLVLCLILIPLLEEPQLEKRFGQSYKIYKKNVPRWLLKLK